LTPSPSRSAFSTTFPTAFSTALSPVLSVVIPAFNEEQTIAPTLRDLTAHMDRLALDWELIVVDDGSTDRTGQIVEQAAATDRRIRLIRGGRGGKGKAIQRGMLEAQGAWRFMADADLAMPPDNLERFLDAVAIAPAPHIVIGSREAPGSLRVGEHWLRHLIGRLFNAHVRIFAIPGVMDTQCGFKLFSAEAAATLFPRLTISGLPSMWNCSSWHGEPGSTCAKPASYGVDGPTAVSPCGEAPPRLATCCGCSGMR
jgi:dolichyl-phosphate beta-glucosyltransferase